MSGPAKAASSVCLAHLVRRLNGVEPLRRFLAAYRCCPGGLDHDLLLLCKGFDGDRLPPEYLDALKDFSYQSLFLGDAGFDIVPYFAAVRHTDHAVYCFLNSFSEPLDPDWLRKLHDALQLPNAGLTGATASWGSLYSHALMQLRRPSVYDGLFDRFAPYGPMPPKYGPLLEPLRLLKYEMHRRFSLPGARRDFLPFPAYHIRSNAFMLRRETMLQTHCGEIVTKLDAMRFESGRDSLTAQVLAGGKSALLVGRDGVGYEKERWPESETFWQGSQRNLLVADNQTLNYARANPAARQFYARYAWGKSARVE